MILAVLRESAAHRLVPDLAMDSLEKLKKELHGLNPTLGN